MSWVGVLSVVSTLFCTLSCAICPTSDAVRGATSGSLLLDHEPNAGASCDIARGGFV